MMRQSIFSTLGIASLVALSSLVSLPANADWADDFNGGLQQSWFFQGQNRTTGTVSTTLTATSVNDVLQVSEPLPSISDGADVAFGVVTTEGFTDVLVTGTVNPTNDPFTSPTLTLLARGNLLSSTFYAAEINYGTSELIIFRGDSATTQANLAMTPISLGFTDDAYLEFELVGADLTATAYDTMGGTMLATVTTNDTTLSTGISGLLIFDSFGGPLMGSYDNISSSHIVTSTLACDSDADMDCDITDLDAMYAAFGAASPANFDFDGNGTIGADDIQGWLTAASVPANTALVDQNDVLVLGDVNLDGDVDSIDLGLLLNNFSAGSGVNWGGGNLDGDNDVDSTDLGLLLNNFGHTSAASFSAVPEPNGVSLLTLAIGLIVMTVRRRR